MVTYNVADNKMMGTEGFDSHSIDSLLGISGGQQPADIIAVGVQEQCWSCDIDQMNAIPNLFLNRLASIDGNFRVIGIVGTRESETCTQGCKKEKTHGTTALFVLARNGLVTETIRRNFTRRCSDYGNTEKGVAYMRLRLTTGKSVCLATCHLESRASSYRRQCLKNFLTDAEEKVRWSSGCDSHFISGDFNTRTNDKKNGAHGNAHLDRRVGSSEVKMLTRSEKLNRWLEDLLTLVSLSLRTQNRRRISTKGYAVFLEELKQQDELNGANPFGRDEEWNDNLLNYINEVDRRSPSPYTETDFSFNPTYKLDTKRPCGFNLCYRKDRPLSWTDRIIHNGATSLKYDSFTLTKSDHLPVFGEFQLP